jgi:nicotinamidase-related amidase
MGSYEDSINKALLVIDIQEDMTGVTATKPHPYKNSQELINNVNSVIKISKEKGIVVVYIKHQYRNSLLSRTLIGKLIKDTAGSEIDSRINIISDNIYSKDKGDAFSNPNLDTFLKQNNINELFLVGLDASACVLKTSIGAKSRGYKVSVLKDAITTMDMSKMPKLLDKYLERSIVLTSIEEFEKIS